MRFVIALAGLLSGASSSIIDDTDDFEDAMPGNLEKIDVFGVLASSPSSSNSKEEESFVRSSSNDHKVKESSPLKKITHGIESREIQNSLLLDKEDNENKGKVVTTLDGHSITNSKQIELCSNILGITNSCSSKEDICVPLTEHQQSILSVETKMAMHLTDEEKRELGICLDLSSIEALKLVAIDGHASTTATVADDEDILHFYFGLEQYSLDTGDGASPYTNDEVNDLRHLQLDNDCDLFCAGFDRPVIEVDGYDFQDLINNCIGDDTSSCPDSYNVPLNCWNTTNVTDMRFAFFRQGSFNKPLGCWDTAKVKDMRIMFFGAREFNQPIQSWDTANVMDMSYMFHGAYEFNHPLESWETSEVEDMASMFYDASAFNQCLSTWANKTGSVDTYNMFSGSGCPSQSDPVPITGPWCQSYVDNCFAPGFEPSVSPSTSPLPSTSPSTAPSTSPSASPPTEPYVSQSAIPSASPLTAPIRSKKEKKTNKKAKNSKESKRKKTKQSKK